MTRKRLGMIVVPVVILFAVWICWPSDSRNPVSVSSRTPASEAAQAGTEKASSKTAKTPVSKMSLKQFKHWFKHEAPRFERFRGGSESVSAKLKAAAQQITAEQAEYLGDFVKNPRRLAHQRILAIYLLGEGSPAARDALAAYLSSSEPNFGVPSPHTIAQMRTGQEHSMRALAAQALLKRAKADTDAAADIQNILKKGDDPYTRAYLRKHLKDLTVH